MDQILKFEIAVPPSSKNVKRMRRSGRVCPACRQPSGPVIMYRPNKVLAATTQIRAAARAAMVLAGYAAEEPLLADDDVAVQMVHDVAREVVEVTVSRIGPRPKGKTGRKRDVVNIPELVLDALQGLAYANDNQVAHLTVGRSLDRC